MQYVEELLLEYPEVYSHSCNVMELATSFAMFTGMYTLREVAVIRTGTLLHDIGKLWVPKEILYKTDKLSKEEFDLVKRHSQWGYDYLLSGNSEAIESRIEVAFTHHARLGWENIGLPEKSDDILAIVLQHHERIDGKGYPHNRKGSEIHPFAKLVALCDVFDAITSIRCYKPEYDADYACACIKDGLGTQFDYQLGELFLDFIRKESVINKNKIVINIA